MDEEESSYDLLQCFNVPKPDNSFSLFSPFGSPALGAMPCNQDIEPMPHKQMKALSVEQMYKGTPPEFQKAFFESQIKNKFFTGIRGLFGIRQQDQSTEFLGSIGDDIFMGDNYESLPDLFPDQDMRSPQQELSSQLDELTKRLSQIQQKAFNSISINKTIGQAFTMHFENFMFVQERSHFMQNFEKALQNLFAEGKKIKTPGTGLIVLIYDFWMKMFRDFVREIWRHSEHYTLSLFKKNKGEPQEAGSNCAHSTTSSSQNGGQKQKRRAWSKSQIQLLGKIIDSNAVFNTARIQELAKQLDRSASSISSKVAKMMKLRKQEGNTEKVEQTSLQSKIKYLLEMNSQGLTKDHIISIMSESFEMGVDDSWKNSVGSILSSCKDIDKIKPPYKLRNPINYYNHAFSNNFKDRIIQCLLNLPNNEGDLPAICQKYSQLFHESGLDLKTNVSKALGRYDIFERQTSRVLYKMAGKQWSAIDVDEYIR